jgi:hypothetical protein
MALLGEQYAAGGSRRAGRRYDHTRDRNRSRRNDAGKIGARRSCPSRLPWRPLAGELSRVPMRVRQCRVRRSGSSGLVIATYSPRNTGISRFQLGQCGATQFSSALRCSPKRRCSSRAVQHHLFEHNIWAANTVAVIHAYDPEIVVFGGGVMQSADVIQPFVEG